MSISSSLNAGVAGLAANATRLATISDNIANSGTYGYKRVNTEFESMVINQARGAGVYSAGGVRATTSRIIDEKGALVSSKNPLDLAISGRGFLPVIQSVDLANRGGGDKPMTMTSTGAFRPDAEGVLRTDSGLVLMGWPANQDGNIPVMSRESVAGLQPVVLNANQPSADPTTAMTIGLDLPAPESKAGRSGDPRTRKVQYFRHAGTAESSNMPFTPPGA